MFTLFVFVFYICISSFRKSLVKLLLDIKIKGNEIFHLVCNILILTGNHEYLFSARKALNVSVLSCAKAATSFPPSFCILDSFIKPRFFW